MSVLPLSGYIGSSSLKSTCLPLASSFAARFLVASKSAWDDDGIPHRAIVSSRPLSAFRTIGTGLFGEVAGHRRQVTYAAAREAEQGTEGGLALGHGVEVANAAIVPGPRCAV